jgi:hypothetical protein
VQFWDAPNGPAVTQTPIEEEWYNRQRPLLPLLDKVPFIQDDTWIAPNAVVVGDVDLYDQVRKQGFQMAMIYIFWAEIVLGFDCFIV